MLYIYLLALWRLLSVSLVLRCEETPTKESHRVHHISALLWAYPVLEFIILSTHLILTFYLVSLAPTALLMVVAWYMGIEGERWRTHRGGER